MTKKDKILKMFNDAEWILAIGEEQKIFTYETFRDYGLSPTIEYGERYCDVIYARMIFQKLGYKVLIGTAMHVKKQ